MFMRVAEQVEVGLFIQGSSDCANVEYYERKEGPVSGNYFDGH